MADVQTNKKNESKSAKEGKKAGELCYVSAQATLEVLLNHGFAVFSLFNKMEGCYRS